MVHCLIVAYNLDIDMDVIVPKPATDEELALFHSQYYLNYLRVECAGKNDTSESDGDSDGSDEVSDEQLMYGLGYDCPKIKNLRKFAMVIAGGTIAAADALLNGS